MMTALLILLTVAGILWTVDRWRQSKVRLEEKKLDLEARKVVLEENRATEPEKIQEEPLPVVFVAMAQAESEPWAREDAIKAYREAHRDTRNWGSVQQIAEANRDGTDWKRLIN